MQQSIDFFTGNELKIIGMQRAENNAGALWAEKAYTHLLNYARTHAEFMAEDMREGFDLPPSLRAWGAIISKAKRNEVITHVGYGQVKNAKAHQANASIWKSLINK